MSMMDAVGFVGSRRNDDGDTWFHRAYRRLTESREAEAKRRAAAYLRHFDDETIKRLGMDQYNFAA